VSDHPALEVRDVSKRFGARWALARVSYSLPAGRSLLLTGHNGSGKTTLLRLISTASFPTAGSIVVFGNETRAAREQVRSHVALLSHASFLYDDLTARQNLGMLADLLGLAPAATVPPLLERVGLAGRGDQPVRQFSAGMRKRLAIARLLMKQPRVALLDEPFGELDPAGIAQMEEFIRELQRGGTSVILATHLIEQGLTLTHERLHLSEGRRQELS
jgi:heme exporter protein A